MIIAGHGYLVIYRNHDAKGLTMVILSYGLQKADVEEVEWQHKTDLLNAMNCRYALAVAMIFYFVFPQEGILYSFC